MSTLLVNYRPDRVREKGEFPLVISDKITLGVSGNQIVDQKAWDEACNHPVKGKVIEEFVALGAIVWSGHLSTGEKDALLNVKNTNQAVRIVRETFDVSLLKIWQAVDDRDVVCQAIDDHIKKIEAKAVLTEEEKIAKKGAK